MTKRRILLVLPVLATILLSGCVASATASTSEDTAPVYTSGNVPGGPGVDPENTDPTKGWVLVATYLHGWGKGEIWKQCEGHHMMYLDLGPGSNGGDSISVVKDDNECVR